MTVLIEELDLDIPRLSDKSYRNDYNTWWDNLTQEEKK